MGFGPQLVDFDGDGHHDVISGDWLARVILFRRTAAGSFCSGEPLTDRHGRNIRIDDYGSYVYAVDWDADGDLDAWPLAEIFWESAV